jgi:ankyrin repeat protein
MFNLRKLLYASVLSMTSAWAGSYEDFFTAISRDDPGTITALLQRGFDPNSTDAKGRAALGLAVHQQSFRAAAALLEHPAIDVNALNASGESALMLASITGERSWVERLIARGASVNLVGWTPLHYAASGPNAAVLELLLARGAEVDGRSPNGTTPLMMAAGYGSEESVQLLLGRGANARLRNDKGLLPADFARQAGRETLAESLTRLAR